MAIKKKWHVIITNTDGPKLVNLSLNRYSAVALMVVLSLFIVTIALSVFFLASYRSNFPQIDRLRSENAFLREELNKLVAEMDSISYRIKQMEEWEDKIRIDRNMGVIDREIRKMGTGGLPQLKVNNPQIDHQLSLDLNLAWHRVDELKNISSFAYEQRVKMIESISLQEEMYRFTPSIYPTFGRISSPYGWRTHPLTKRRQFHSGLDISNKSNSPIYVTADGTVKEIGYTQFYGRYMIVTHKFGYETLYAHLNKTLSKRGDTVVRGDIIALMGNTGRSTGSHLHYEVRKHGKTVNPYRYLNKMEADIIVTQK